MVIGVSKDNIDSHNRFAGNSNYLLLSDPQSDVMKEYGAFGKKMMYGKEVQGTIPFDCGGRAGRCGDQALAGGQEC